MRGVGEGLGRGRGSCLYSVFIFFFGWFRSLELVQEAIANFEKESASLESIYLNLLSLEDGLEENEKTAEERDGMEDDALAAARGKRDALRDEVRRKNEVLCILMKRTREMVLLLQQLQLQKNSGER